MLCEIIGDVYKGVRQRGGLNADEAAAAISKARSIVYRIEKGEQLLKPEQEKVLLKKGNLSREAFVQVVCDVLSEYLGRPVRIAPRGQFLPEAPLKRAADLYARHQSELTPELRELIEGKLHVGRLLDAAADQAASLAAKEIRNLIEEARGEVKGHEVAQSPEG